ncbi:hypothetical protein [Schumannella sp. 10F1B-5-1]|uniref:hypothetical protein n=1 Tax=Schumannella sp. 10F1B-5-1 TaxID=2590780 RepID=UPI001131B39B|nr:hypothetical protein [Schumannella sp. 10F1B-5-1]TPW78505.1 hypothetical protein FJ658_01560 [Schumannella sp. 10F1B-5-1]
MTERENGPWSQSNLGSNVVGGLILLGPSVLVNAVTDHLELWQRVLVVALAAALAGFVLSVTNRYWRRRIWIHFASWMRDTRPVVSRAKTVREHSDARYAAGYTARSKEVADERAAVVINEPAWAIDAKDSFFGDEAMFWMTNRGAEAWDVVVTAPDELFRMSGDVFFQGRWNPSTGGSSTARWFRGTATERGRNEGVVFRVSWRDPNGDEHSRDVFMLPEALTAPIESREVAFARGHAAGLAEARSSSTPETPVPPDLPPLPLPAPRWSIHEDNTGDEMDFVLRNSVARSVALEVRIEPDEDLRLASAGHWENVSGENTASFAGSLSDRGYEHGVRFFVSWYDEMHSARTEWVELPGHGRPPRTF